MHAARPPALPVATALLLTLAAADARAEGVYTKVFAGAAQQRDQRLAYTDALTSDSGNARFDAGLLAGGAIGYRFAGGWRLEGEFVYQSVDHDGDAFAAAGPVGSGNYASTSVAVNALYEFGGDADARWRPYAGVGVARLTEVDIDFEANGGERSYSGSDTGVQVLAGVRYRLGPSWYLDGGARYLRASGVRLDGEGTAPGRITADYSPWALTLGIGYDF